MFRHTFRSTHRSLPPLCSFLLAVLLGGCTAPQASRRSLVRRAARDRPKRQTALAWATPLKGCGRQDRTSRPRSATGPEGCASEHLRARSHPGRESRCRRIRWNCRACSAAPRSPGRELSSTTASGPSGPSISIGTSPSAFPGARALRPGDSAHTRQTAGAVVCPGSPARPSSEASPATGWSRWKSSPPPSWKTIRSRLSSASATRSGRSPIEPDDAERHAATVGHPPRPRPGKWKVVCLPEVLSNAGTAIGRLRIGLSRADLPMAGEMIGYGALRTPQSLHAG